jgi:hypothetical protein
VVALRIPKSGWKRAEYWSTAEPYHYVRGLDWGEEDDLIIVGGEVGRKGKGLLVFWGFFFTAILFWL